MTSGMTRQVSYALVTAVPDQDFTLQAIAFISGSKDRANWQMKADYSEHVPGPLPILAGIAAFGLSRKLRKKFVVDSLRSTPSRLETSSLASTSIVLFH